MAKKTKKTKITETIVNQLQQEEEKQPKVVPQKSKSFDTPVKETIDPGVAEFNSNLGNIL